MIEQSILHGRVYLSTIHNNTLVSKQVSLECLAFGPMRPITIYSDSEYIYVRNNNTGAILAYKDGILQEDVTPEKLPTASHAYYYGMATYTNEKSEITHYPYYLQNEPMVSLEFTPDITTFELPYTLRRLDYEEDFTYVDELKHVLGNLPATYVDIFKRPITSVGGHVYPIHIDKVQTKFKDLQVTTYPVTIQFANTDYAVVDLEPGYTPEDLEHFKSLKGYYVEDTPRGGKHMLVAIDSDVYKFRHSEKLEIINNSQATMYGLNGKWLSDNPVPIDVSSYQCTGSTNNAPTLTTKPVSAEVEAYVDAVKLKSEENMSTGPYRAGQALINDDDTSHGEYMALYILYTSDIKPYEQSIPSELLPWVIEAYARDYVPWREKHETLRKGVPYLVHLANSIVHYQKKGGS